MPPRLDVSVLMREEVLTERRLLLTQKKHGLAVLSTARTVAIAGPDSFPFAVRLVTYRSDRGPRAGVDRDGGVIGPWDARGESDRSSLRELIAEGRVSDLDAADGEPMAGAELLPPIPDPEKIICIG